jgi:hypothetical protein
MWEASSSMSLEFFRRVGENIRLDALEYAKTPVEARVEAIDLGVLCSDLLNAEATGVTG